MSKRRRSSAFVQIAFLSVFICFYSFDGTSAEVTRSQPLLGTYVQVILEGDDEAALNEAATSAFQQIRKVQDALSSHLTNNDVARINENAGSGPVKVSELAYSALRSSLAVSRETHGAFDITLRPLLDLWGFVWKRRYAHPSNREIEEQLRLVDYSQVELLPDQQVSLKRRGMKMDFGGIGKGIAVDEAVKLLRNNTNVVAGMVKAGGDLRCFGPKPFRIAIAHPRKEEEIWGYVTLQDQSLSTSGDYENYFMEKGVRYSHILDPTSGFPVKGIASVTVVAADCTTSDAMATAFMVLGPEESLQVSSRISSNLQAFFILDKECELITISSKDFPLDK